MTSTPAMPTEQDLETLPYFAILALGARCARHIAPLFGTWQRAPEEHVRAVADAVQAVEDLAASPDALSRAPQWAAAADAALLAADAASAADSSEAPTSAICAADAAAELANAIDPDGPRKSAARAVWKAMRASAEAVDRSAAGGKGEFLSQLAAVLDRLRSQALTEGWTDETGVSILEPGDSS